MSDMIGKYDRQDGEEMAWHNKTKLFAKGELCLENCWPSQWDVERVGLQTPDGVPVIVGEETIPGRGREADQVVKHQLSILRATDEPSLIIGKAFNPATYSPLTNKAFLDMIRKATAGMDMRLVSAMSCEDRNKVSLSFRLTGLEKFKSADRDFEAFLNFLNSHDQSTAIVASTSNVCVVCRNTFGMALNSKGKAIDARVKHTKEMAAELENLPAIVEAAIGVQAEFAAALDSLAQKPVNADAATRIYTGWLCDDFDAKSEDEDNGKNYTVSTRTQNRVNRLVELFQDKAGGNRGENLSDVFGAVTDYYSHESAGGKDRVKQVLSSEMGSAARAKSDFWATIRDDKKLKTVSARGKAILDLA